MRNRHQYSPVYFEALESRDLLSAAPVMAKPVATRELTVMSRNLYQGADLTPVISLVAIGDFAHVPAAVSQVWAAQLATDFNLRAPALADEIAAAKPDIIGMQEVSQWVFIAPGAAPQVTDFLQILTANLSLRGMHYTPIVVTANYTATLPDDKGDYISLTDRNVILVNDDAKRLNVISSSDGHYAAQFTVGTFFNENNSWQSIDGSKGGRMFHYVNTHLTSVSPSLQVMQTAELLSGPAATNLPLILSGDFNSDAYHGAYGGEDITGTYDLLAGGGLTDAWTATHHHGDLGLTWGPNDNVNSPVPTFNERIDFVWTRGRLQTRSMSVVGTTPLTLSGGLTWATDHAGIVTTVQLTAANSSPHKHSRAKGHFATA